MRGSAAGKLALLNGVYLPAVMVVLASVSEGSGHYQNRRWFTVFSAKCTHLGIDLEKTIRMRMRRDSCGHPWATW